MSCYRWQPYNYDITGSDFLCWLSQVPVPTFSGKEHSRSLLALDDNIELNSFTDVAIDETTESKATKSKIKTEVEHSRSLPALDNDIELDSCKDYRPHSNIW